MGNINYYCHNNYCRRIFNDKDPQIPITEYGQELDGKKLCRDCYEYGFRLKKGIVVVKSK